MIEPLKDNTKRENPLRLVDDGTLKEMMLDWIKGVDPDRICEKYNLTRIQFHRQKYYYKNVVLGEVVKKVFMMRDRGFNSVEIGHILDIPFETINKIIARELLL